MVYNQVSWPFVVLLPKKFFHTVDSTVETKPSKVPLRSYRVNLSERPSNAGRSFDLPLSKTENGGHQKVKSLNS